jgi:serine/threonine protein kinase
LAGRGSYGSVYKALLKATGEFVAIKVIQHGEGDKIADIQKEISMLSECKHPNVVRYIVHIPRLLPSSILHTLTHQEAHRIRPYTLNLDSHTVLLGQ